MLELEEILEATRGSLVSSGKRHFASLSIDSRTIGIGELFLAIKGERLDGHDFVEKSLSVGAGAIVSRSWIGTGRIQSQGKTIIAVDDTLKALHDLARFIRKRFKGPVVAVVGSNGKTTTKELVSSILGTSFNVLRTEGNLNNHIGMPLCITRASDKTEAMVLEMGTNRPGDVDLLCSIASPDLAVVTNIGFEHLEGFGSIEAVRDAELEILSYAGKLALNGDDDFLIGGIPLKFRGPVTTFGIEKADCDVTARNIEISGKGTRFDLCIEGKSMTVESRLSGRFNVYNALASCAVAHILGLGIDKMKEGIEAFGGVKMRFEIKHLDGVTYLYDVYNANPSSMKASIAELARVSGSECKGSGCRAIAVLGDMLELGDFAKAAHEEIACLLSESKVDIFIGVGPLMAAAVGSFVRAGRKGIATDSSEDAGSALSGIVKKPDVVLIKGSRGMRMEKVMDVIENAAVKK